MVAPTKTRVLVDTNILVSAVMFPNSTPAEALKLVIDECEMFLSKANLTELTDVLTRKAPHLLSWADSQLKEWDFEVVSAEKSGPVEMRDSKDQPILDAAINANVDVILTGDKDFLCLEIDHPAVLTARQFLARRWKR